MLHKLEVKKIIQHTFIREYNEWYNSTATSRDINWKQFPDYEELCDGMIPTGIRLRDKEIIYDENTETEERFQYQDIKKVIELIKEIIPDF